MYRREDRHPSAGAPSASAADAVQRPARASHDYIHNGTIELVTEEVPDDVDVHVILDNASTHETPATQRWLEHHPRFQFRFTPTSSSWLNLVERLFPELTNKKLRYCQQFLTQDTSGNSEHSAPKPPTVRV